jgi:hypothetical protein
MIVIPLTILALIGTAGVVQAKRSKAGTDPRTLAERQVIYDTAINEVKDPEKLRTLAAAFRQTGMAAEADMLEKRAALQSLPDDVKAARKEAFRQGMASTDPVKINVLADAFHSQGATGAADNLRKYAAGLTAATVEETANVQT